MIKVSANIWRVLDLSSQLPLIHYSFQVSRQILYLRNELRFQPWLQILHSQTILHWFRWYFGCCSILGISWWDRVHDDELEWNWVCSLIPSKLSQEQDWLFTYLWWQIDDLPKNCATNLASLPNWSIYWFMSDYLKFSWCFPYFVQHTISPLQEIQIKVDNFIWSEVKCLWCSSFWVALAEESQYFYWECRIEKNRTD